MKNNEKTNLFLSTYECYFVVSEEHASDLWHGSTSSWLPHIAEQQCFVFLENMN